MNKYTVEKVPSTKDFDVYYVLKESDEVLFRVKGETLSTLYECLFVKDKELFAKMIWESNKDIPKEAVDFLVEQTYNELK